MPIGLKPQKVIVILGPTATGKSDLAVKLAKRFNGEIVSADSRQVYRGLDIGTGKITEKEMEGVTHYLLDVSDPKRRFTVIDFRDMANDAIQKIVAKGKLPIICGGTGFYIKTLLENTDLPDTPPNNKLRAELAKLSADELLGRLKELDPKRYSTIEKQNLRRVIRAIEIATYLKTQPRTVTMNEVTNNAHSYSALKIGISIPGPELRIRIKKRLLKRIGAGMIEEAKKLHKKGLSWRRMEELGLEYKYLAKFLKDEMTKEQMINKLETEIWRYSKRQMTWFKRDRNIQWLNGADFKSASDLAKAFLSYN